MIGRRLVPVLASTLLLLSACSSSNEIGGSGVTVDDIANAVEDSEERSPLADRPAASLEGVNIRANLCETTDPDYLDDGLRRRVWISIENTRPEIVSVMADIIFTDGTVLRSDSHDVGAASDGAPGTNSFGTDDTIEQSPDDYEADCFSQIDSIAIVEVGEPVWMTPEDDPASG